MKKNIFSIALLLVMILSLMLMTTGCNSDAQAAADEAALRIAALEQENSELQSKLNELTAQMDSMKQKASLQDWNLDAKAWSDGNGATVTFTATPFNYVDGQRAALSVRMGDLEAEGTNCVWDGTVFSGSVELSAADGYSYYCVLTNLDGTQSEMELNAPGNVTNDALVNLGSSLSAYANLVVENWEATGTALSIKSGYMQAQMPRLTFNDMEAKVSAAALVLKLNDEEVGRQDVTLNPGEGEGSFEADIEGYTFTIPTVEDEHQLDLWLEVTLNTGNTVSVAGGSWYTGDGQLQLVVG